MFDPEKPVTAWLKREDGTISEEGYAYLKLMNDPQFMELVKRLRPASHHPSLQPGQS